MRRPKVFLKSMSINYDFPASQLHGEAVEFAFRFDIFSNPSKYLSAKHEKSINFSFDSFSCTISWIFHRSEILDVSRRSRSMDASAKLSSNSSSNHVGTIILLIEKHQSPFEFSENKSLKIIKFVVSALEWRQMFRLWIFKRSSRVLSNNNANELKSQQK